MKQIARKWCQHVVHLMSEGPHDFVCPLCGQSHEGEPTDYGWALPDDIWNLGEPVRQEHLEWSTDLAYLDGRWFLRGVLETPFQFSDWRFAWGVWAEVSEATFATYYEVFEQDGSHLPPEPTRIANALPELYPTTLGLEVKVKFGPADRRPGLKLDEECPHPLAVEQHLGISIERYHEILSVIRP
jgi:hypothetical protein